MMKAASVSPQRPTSDADCIITGAGRQRVAEGVPREAGEDMAAQPFGRRHRAGEDEDARPAVAPEQRARRRRRAPRTARGRRAGRRRRAASARRTGRRRRGRRRRSTTARRGNSRSRSTSRRRRPARRRADRRRAVRRPPRRRSARRRPARSAKSSGKRLNGASASADSAAGDEGNARAGASPMSTMMASAIRLACPTERASAESAVKRPAACAAPVKPLRRPDWPPARPRLAARLAAAAALGFRRRCAGA